MTIISRRSLMNGSLPETFFPRKTNLHKFSESAPVPVKKDGSGRNFRGKFLKPLEKRRQMLRRSSDVRERLGCREFKSFGCGERTYWGAEGNLPGILRGWFPFPIRRLLPFAVRSFSSPKAHSVLCPDSASAWVWPAAEDEDPRSAE